MQGGPLGAQQGVLQSVSCSGELYRAFVASSRPVWGHAGACFVFRGSTCACIIGLALQVFPTVPIVAPTIADADKNDDAYVELNLKLLRNPGLINLLDGCAVSLPCHAPHEAPVGPNPNLNPNPAAALPSTCQRPFLQLHSNSAATPCSCTPPLDDYDGLPPICPFAV